MSVEAMEQLCTGKGIHSPRTFVHFAVMNTLLTSGISITKYNWGVIDGAFCFPRCDDTDEVRTQLFGWG